VPWAFIFLSNKDIFLVCKISKIMFSLHCITHTITYILILLFTLLKFTKPELPTPKMSESFIAYSDDKQIKTVIDNAKAKTVDTKSILKISSWNEIFGKFKNL
jgi:hypothetical protein